MNEINGNSKYRHECAEQVGGYALLGWTVRRIAEQFSVEQHTLHRWTLQYPEFGAALKAGQAEADGKVATVLYERALKGEAWAVRFWLMNRDPEHWRDKVDLNLDFVPPASILANLSDDQLNVLYKRFLRMDPRLLDGALIEGETTSADEDEGQEWGCCVRRQEVEAIGLL